LARLLTHIVEKSVAGQREELKEYSLGLDIFERGEEFDPKTDSIVRSSARQLRLKLAEYYETRGREDAVHIRLPKGGYVAEIEHRRSPATLPEPTTPPRWRGSALVATSAGLLLVVVAIVGFRTHATSGTILPAPAPATSVAVLPFLNPDGRPEDERMTDGLAEELTNRLARIGELRVVARRSAFQFKGKTYDVKDIAAKLHVGSILEGSFRKTGNAIEITVELISVGDGFVTWSDQFPTSDRDLYNTEDEILTGVLRALKVTPKGGLETLLHRSPPPDPEAHRLYLEGRYFWNERTYEAIKRAIALYEQALRIDPSYAPAHAGLAECYGVIAANGLADTQTAAAQGRVAARRAIEIDPAAAEAFAALGLIQSVADWDWPGADASFRQAIASNPNCANAYQWQAHNLLWQARFPEALAAIQKALDLDSLSPVILSNQAEFAYFMHDYSKALQLYQHTLDLNPGFISANIEIGMTLNRMGRQREAIRCFEKARSLSSEEASPLVGLAIANANLGNIPEAKRLLDQLQADSKVLHVSNFQFATMYAALGDTDRAISALERSYAEHEGFLIAIKVHPDLDPLRSDPRFAALQRKMRL